MTVRPDGTQDEASDAALRRAGLKVTASRRVVYESLRASSHASAERIFERIRDALPGANLQSVYNALGDFVDAGLARRIEPAGAPGLFELRVGDNHHHVVCSSCGAVEDVDCVTGAAPCLAPSESHGYRIDVAEVTFWGLCPDCSWQQSAPPLSFETTGQLKQGAR